MRVRGFGGFGALHIWSTFEKGVFLGVQKVHPILIRFKGYGEVLSAGSGARDLSGGLGFRHLFRRRIGSWGCHHHFMFRVHARHIALARDCEGDLVDNVRRVHSVATSRTLMQGLYL